MLSSLPFYPASPRSFSHLPPTFSPLHFSSTTQIFNSLRIFFDTQLIFSTLYSGHTYYYIILLNYLTSCSSTSPIIKINTNQFPSLPQIMLGLSYAQFYRSHRGVLLLALPHYFPTPSPVPSPFSRLCVPQLPALNPIPIPGSFIPVLTPTPSILSLPPLPSTLL